MLRRGILTAATAVFAVGCASSTSTSLAGFSVSRPPSADTVLVFVSGSWSQEPAPREILALNADGSKVERLTSCAGATDPCDIQQAILSSDRTKAIALRSTASSGAGVAAIYYMDLARSVESVVGTRRQVSSVDWSLDNTFIVYSAPAATNGYDDLFYALTDGTQETDLTQSTTTSEPTARIDPGSRTAVYTQVDPTGKGQVFVYTAILLDAGGPGTTPLPGTPYVLGSDSDPAYSPDGTMVVFRRLTSVGNGGLGTWDIMTIHADGTGPQVIATGDVFRGAPDWGPKGIVFVETDAASAQSSLVVIQPDGSGRTVLRTESSAYGMAAPRWLP